MSPRESVAREALPVLHALLIVNPVIDRYTG